MRSDLQKGSIILVDAIWYVVVGCVILDGKIHIDCICDHANNVHSWTPECVDYCMTPYAAMRAHGWGHTGDDKLRDIISKREIPVDVIAEVLAGVHDTRFD